MKVNKRNLILTSLLLFTIPLCEIHRIFHVPELRERNLFLFSEKQQDIEWYIKDSEDCLRMIIILFVFYIKLKRYDVKFSFFILLILWYSITDFVMYWINNRHAGIIYTLATYGTMLAVILVNYKKWKPQ